MTEELQKKLDELPGRPGVYLMKDRQGRVIYVGKAVNLKNRVKSYFTRGSSDARAFVALLDRVLGDLETVVVATEKEALLLENELIKKHRPRFNVQLRDDKNFLCLRLDVSQTYPRLETVRRPKRDGARYFGPYASAHSIRETLRVVNKHFQLRTCSDHVLANRKRPCLLHQIGRCPAPCVFPIPAEEYRKNVDAVSLFLEGRSGPLLDGLRERMKGASAKLEFEEAARLRDQVIALERSLERQAVATTDEKDLDVFGLHREADRICIYALFLRGGRISGGRAHHFASEFPDEELIASFVNQYYGDENYLPEEVLLPFAPNEPEALSELLTERRGEKVRVHVPRRGEKVGLVKLATTNAERAFSERKRSARELEEVLERLKTALHLTKLPHRMECFDISHLQGDAVVASQVSAWDTEPDPSRYRRMKLRGVKRNDDFAAMHEVVSRRLKRGLLENDLPDLIVVDGGKGQLQAAQAALKDLGVEGVEMVALAKSRDFSDADHLASLIPPPSLGESPPQLTAREPVRTPERVFLAGRKDPIVLNQTSPELFALTRLRDEAHRFAITFQRKLMRRRGLASELDQIPGVGKARRTALLERFGSLKRIKEATIEELAETEGLGPSVAERVHAFLHAPKAKDVEEEEWVREASLEDAGG